MSNHLSTIITRWRCKKHYIFFTFLLCGLFIYSLRSAHVKSKARTQILNFTARESSLKLNEIKKTRDSYSISTRKTDQLNLTKIKAWKIGFHAWCIEHQRKNASFTLYADKHWAKSHVQQLIPNLKVAKEFAFVNSSNDIDNTLLLKLPQKYVFKANNMYGGIAIVQGGIIKCITRPCSWQGKKTNLQYLKDLCAKWLVTDYVLRGGEIYYRDIEPKCMFEEYLGNGSQLVDYKIFTYHGIPYIVELHENRFTNYSKSYYTPNWNHIKMVRWPRTVPNFSNKKRPVFLEKMLQYSKILSKNFRMMRIDFMSVGDTFVFAEYSPSPANCQGHYEPLSVEKFYGYVAENPNENVNPEDVLLFIS